MNGIAHCHYCGTRFEASPRILDYIEPRSSGGANKPAHIVFACEPCVTPEATA